MGRLRAAIAALALALAPVAGVVGPVAAQELGSVRSPILTIDSERLFAESLFGRRVAEEVEAEGAVLAAENRRIEAELTAEESELTERRASLPPEEFRALADAFDEKVQTIRREQDAKTRQLGQQRDADRLAFLNAARPVLGALMREADAVLIIDRRNVFLGADVIDITDRAIERLNAAIGDGADPPESDN